MKQLLTPQLPKTFFSSDQLIRLQQLISQNQTLIEVSGLVGSALSMTVAKLFLDSDRPFLWLLESKESAAYHLNDLENILGEENVMFYPASYRRPYEIEETDNANVLLRAKVLNRINTAKRHALVVTYPEALFEKVVTKKTLEKSTLSLKVGEKVSLDFVNETLFEYGFNRQDFVTEAGEFSVRGGILDVFSYAHEFPFRIEFFGNEVESIRSFDVETQLSDQPYKKIKILPNVENKLTQENRQDFMHLFPEKSLFLHHNLSASQAIFDGLFEKAQEQFLKLKGEIKHAQPSDLFLDGENFCKLFQDYNRLHFSSSKSQEIGFDTLPQMAFNRQFHLLVNTLKDYDQKGFQNILFCSNEQQAKRFHDIFEELSIDLNYQTKIFPLYQGFVDHQSKLVCYTDHQIFERYHKFNLKTNTAKKQALALSELNQLQVGDYVTHIDHGIGRFGGLQKIEVEGKTQESLKLIYGDRDILYVSIHALHKISKYNGKDGVVPRLYKLGSGAWAKVKQKTKKRIREVAFNLIQVYAKQRMKKGFQCAPDSYLQHELEASFMYEDTPDQVQATADVKADMESERPMDRLVCGDVGFGKTEVAIRAAFKAIDNGKQVAVLVPTTILAYQHYKTFSQRLSDFPVSVDYLNRFRSAKEKKEVQEGLRQGKIDLIIGTHQLVNAAVTFKDLGLLIVDEEQKFGVAVKEKLRSIKENVDVLTLTATPIPRTLQFSLMSARDLSVINTPPPNRYPIESQVIGFQEETIRDAISYEIQRGGQTFFIHNRIENIKEVAGMIQRLVPDAKIAVGHGQLDGKKLETLMIDFMRGAYDVLVSTTIVESGLDVPNANTIFINQAQHFGLSDLHQMRGRVGRSNKKAFCYFITAPYSTLTEDARKRIQALEQHTALGVGFQIALKDLEIRGAGDLLGGEQSGFINDIGFETYQKILNETIEELKEKEFEGLYESSSKAGKHFVRETQIDTDFELLFPDDYVNSIKERLQLYSRLANIDSKKGLFEFETELKDRFGTLPTQTVDLLNSVRLKWIAQLLGWEKLLLQKGVMLGYFIADPQNAYYQSEGFKTLLVWIQKNKGIAVLKEKETRNGLRLFMRFDNIRNVEQALNVLKPLENELKNL